MLKKVSIDKRAVLLQIFTKELVLNSVPKESLIIKKQVIKEKTDFLKKALEKKGELKDYTVSESLDISKKDFSNNPVKKELHKPLFFSKQRIPVRKELLFREKIPAKIKRAVTSPVNNSLPNIPSRTVLNYEVDLGRLGYLLSDKEVSVIECPGSDEFLFLKKFGKVQLVKIKLSQSEIDNILNSFSAKARIPIMEGVFKAIVGALSINAIVTNSSGSRFMLYRKNTMD